MGPKSTDLSQSPIPIRDQGPSPFFHGREDIIITFNRVLSDSISLNAGTTFLIQGAPGAGKTALIDVLAKDAKKSGWAIAHLVPNALWNPDELLRRLKKSGRQVTGFSGEVGVDSIGHANINIDMKIAVHTISDILRSQKKPLLLILDEAQALGLPDMVPPEMKGITTSVLKEIHNGDLERPLMLLAGGLGTTEAALSGLGISRIDGDCTVHLGRLDKESESEVIRDWLTQAGGAKDDPSTWIESIAQQAHGWPQHIISYIKPAVKHLKSNLGRMTHEGLQLVLGKGAQYREEYYESRAHNIDEDHRKALSRAVKDVPLDSTTTRVAIIHSLEHSGFTPEDADELFTQALDQGIIDQRKRGRYGIPIPSMHTWLLDEYVKENS